MVLVFNVNKQKQINSFYRYLIGIKLNFNSILNIMAFVENIIHNENILDTILEIKRITGARYIEKNKSAATTIQRHYRGYYTRSYISKLNLAATVIQKNWRRYIAKRYANNYEFMCSVNLYPLHSRHLNDLAINAFVLKSIDYYNKAATIIQKYFKGFYTRKHYLDIKKRKKSIKEIQKINDDTSKLMHDYKKYICTELEKINKEKVKCFITEIVNKHHSMLRTKIQKGVFSRKEDKADVYSDSEFEKLIRDIFVHVNKKKTKT